MKALVRSRKPSPRIAGIVLIHLLSPERVEGGQARDGIEITMMFLSPGIFAGMVALYKRVDDERVFATNGQDDDSSSLEINTLMSKQYRGEPEF